MLDRSIAPPIQPIRPFDFVKPNTTILPNGVKLHTINSGNQPIVSLQLVFSVDHTFSDVEVYAPITARMLLEGTSRHTAEQIAEIMADHGAFLDADVAFDLANLELYCLTKHLPKLIDLLLELLNHSLFPEEELQHVKRVMYQKEKINLERSQIVSSFKFRENLFGKEHPYGRHKELTKIQRVDRKKVIDYHQTVYKSQPFDLIMAGKFSDNDLSMIQDLFGALKFDKVTQATRPVVYDVPELKNKKVIENKEDAVQTSVRVGRVLFAKRHADYLKFSVLNTILGGYFGSRLMMNIRERKGYTYGIYSSMITLKNAGYMVIGGDVKKEFREEVMAEIMYEMRRLCTEVVEEEELSRVKNYICGSFVKSFKDPIEIASRYRNIYFYELPSDYFSNYIRDVQSIDASELQTLAQKYFQEDRFLSVLIG